MINTSSNIVSAYRFFSSSLQETVSIGFNVGSEIVSGITVTLSGDFGSGKTSFTKGLVRGLGLVDTKYVNSPSYSLINRYVGNLLIYHVDLCRINSVTDLEEIGFMDLFDSDAVVVIEWPEILDSNNILAKRIEVEIEMVGAFERKIRILSKGFALNL